MIFSSSPQLQVLAADDPEWTALLDRAARADTYHSAGYHQLAAAQGEGQPQLFVYREGDQFIALPLLLRDLQAVPGLGEFPAAWRDATSIYGYGGPFASHETLPADLIARFQAALGENLRAGGVVTLFSRLHPLLEQTPWLEGLGEIVPGGQTISIDLTQTEEAYALALRRNHRRSLNHAAAAGLTVFEDREWQHLDDFLRVYEETMRRVAAADYYFFPASYYRELFRVLGQGVRLFVAKSPQGEIAGAVTVLFCQDIAQYHLGGTAATFAKQAPMILLTEETRKYARAAGYRWLHLGGGVGSQPDSLFHFKAGFSDRRHQFSTWRWILEREKFQTLCAARAQWNERTGHTCTAPGYFPAYRAASALAVPPR